MAVLRSLGLFVVAAIAEIGGAWLVWQGIREHRGMAWVGAGVAALGVYGFVATRQPDAHFGRILAAYGGIFVAGYVDVWEWAHAAATDRLRRGEADLRDRPAKLRFVSIHNACRVLVC